VFRGKGQCLGVKVGIRVGLWSGFKGKGHGQGLGVKVWSRGKGQG